ncbi:alpha/beta hydrolase family protein [Sediminibacillus albus]|uniref:Prolyl oligopeptidase family protein n=1 Tax=Sediminibacillus albus TaxID=407036 RepID=A0A1G9AHR1_9BACI|nr:prolyl oligopeptidase family serine peptidase [Sediminibacillus albus]SDK26798.1 Prolyl oligopeptidase family protein [Sediminibacillus albus]
MIAFVKNKEILGELYLPNVESSNKIGIVWLPGLPNNPMAPEMGKPLSDLGFTVLQARYPGNWQSYGNFGPSSSVDGALMGVELLANGSTINLNTEKIVTWDVKHIVLIGNSYGGGIAVSALGSSNLASAAIAFCPLLEPSLQNADNSQKEDDLSTLYPYLRRCHENVYRNLDDNEWNEYIEGRHPVDPSRFITKIKDRPLLLFHGSEDKGIRPHHTEDFYSKLKRSGAEKAEFIIKEGVGHGKRLRTSTWDVWTKWLVNLFN